MLIHLGTQHDLDITRLPRRFSKSRQSREPFRLPDVPQLEHPLNRFAKLSLLLIDSLLPVIDIR